MDIQILRFSVRHNGKEYGPGTVYDMDDEAARKLVEESNGDIIELPPRPAASVQPPVQDPPKDPEKDKADGKGKNGSTIKGDAVDNGSGENNQPAEDGTVLPPVDPNELKK